jgi:rod shape-determining protein MreC
VALRRTGSVTWLAAPFKGLAPRLVVPGLLLLSVALIALSRAEPRLLERMRMAVIDVTLPVIDAISQPIVAGQRVAETVGELATLHAENAQLRADNARLQQWQIVARTLDHENRELRRLLHVPGDPPLGFVTARVVANAGGPFMHSVLVLAGTSDGVAKGQPAVTTEGLIGRVSEIGAQAARVLLLTDMNSHVPVLIERTRERAIAAGDNSGFLRLLFVSPTAQPQVGDRLVTSGQGGVFPPGLPVGVVVGLRDGLPLVQPFADGMRLEFVRIVDYGLGGVLPQSVPPPARGRGAR